MDIDASYDFRNDVRPNNDPDIHSKKLKLYHKTLWSKPLPSGENFLLDYSITGKYLSSKSSVGEFELSSDSITHSYIGVKRMNYGVRKRGVVGVGVTEALLTEQQSPLLVELVDH